MRSIRRAAPDTVTIDYHEVAGPAGAAGSVEGGQPGQFHMLWVPGVGEVPISMSGADQHTIRSVGAVTAALCALEPGDLVGVRGPYGRGWGLEETAGTGTDLVLVAGGLGLAPLRSAVEAVLAERGRYGPVRLLIGARHPDELLFDDEYSTWREAGVEVAVTVDRADDRWSGEVGLVTRLLPAAITDPANTVVMVCGPEVMMRHTASSVLNLGVRASAVRLSLERNMHCGVGLCGHCQLGPIFVCLDGPVVSLDRVDGFVWTKEL